MVTTTVSGNQMQKTCLETDEKPIEGVENGTPLVVMSETNGLQVFFFDAENKKWLPV